MKIEITNDDGTVHVIEPKFFGVQKVVTTGKEARIIVFSDDFIVFESAKNLLSTQSVLLYSDGKTEQSQVC